MSCVVAGLRYYFRIYKYEYLGELMNSELHKALDIVPTNGGQCHTPPYRVGRGVV